MMKMVIVCILENMQVILIMDFGEKEMEWNKIVKVT